MFGDVEKHLADGLEHQRPGLGAIGIDRPVEIRVNLHTVLVLDPFGKPFEGNRQPFLENGRREIHRQGT